MKRVFNKYFQIGESDIIMTDWIMIGITSVYVVATILICIFNYRSAKATKEQVSESIRQFKESNRAFVTITFEIIRSGLAVLHIQNHGKQIAKDVHIQVSQAFMRNMTDLSDRKNLETLSNSTFSLGIGQSWYCLIGSHLQLKQMSKEILHLNFSYSDYFNIYHESTDIDLKQYFWSLIYDSPIEDTYKEMKKIPEDLESINKSINNLK